MRIVIALVLIADGLDEESRQLPPALGGCRQSCQGLDNGFRLQPCKEPVEPAIVIGPIDPPAIQIYRPYFLFSHKFNPHADQVEVLLSAKKSTHMFQSIDCDRVMQVYDTASAGRLQQVVIQGFI